MRVLLACSLGAGVHCAANSSTVDETHDRIGGPSTDSRPAHAGRIVAPRSPEPGYRDGAQRIAAELAAAPTLDTILQPLLDRRR